MAWPNRAEGIGLEVMPAYSMTSYTWVPQVFHHAQLHILQPTVVDISTKTQRLPNRELPTIPSNMVHHSSNIVPNLPVLQSHHSTPRLNHTYLRPIKQPATHFSQATEAKVVEPPRRLTLLQCQHSLQFYPPRPLRGLMSNVTEVAYLLTWAQSQSHSPRTITLNNRTHHRPLSLVNSHLLLGQYIRPQLLRLRHFHLLKMHTPPLPLSQLLHTHILKELERRRASNSGLRVDHPQSIAHCLRYRHIIQARARAIRLLSYYVDQLGPMPR